MSERTVAVVGGTGFLGRAVVTTLLSAGCRVRVVARRPGAVDFSGCETPPETVRADIDDARSLTEAVDGAAAVVNAVSLYVEKGDLTFERIHVEGAERLARCAKAAGVETLVQISGIGVDPDSPSKYIRARTRGEQAVSRAFPGTVMLRPSVLFGPDDAFLQAIDGITVLPVVPLFGSGGTRLQPVYVGDVAAAVARVIERPELKGRVFELGGGEVHTYRQIVEAVMAYRRRKRLLLPVPFAVWKVMVAPLAVLPAPPLTRDQLFLMETDNVAGEGAAGFADLGLEPRRLSAMLGACLAG